MHRINVLTNLELSTGYILEDFIICDEFEFTTDEKEQRKKEKKKKSTTEPAGMYT